jgi:hypothetical protein
MKIQVDDILAALILSLAMLRRLEVRSARAADQPSVRESEFQRWRSLALRGYDQVAFACGVKVALSIGWYALALRLSVPAPWFQLGGFFVFLAWTLTMVWAWKIATDARHLRMQLGIVLRRRSAESPPGAPRSG